MVAGDVRRPGALRRMGRHLRAALRMTGLLGCLAVLTPLVQAARAGLLGRRRKSLLWRVRCQRRLLRLALRCGGFRLDVEGHPAVQPAVIICNHVSYMDIALLAACLDTSFVGMAQIAKWPLIGAAGLACGSIFIDRSRVGDVLRAGRQMESVIAQGAFFVIFPEGSAGDGSSVRDFHAAILAPPARRGLPVCCAALGYATPPGELPAGRLVGWWEKITLLQHAWRMLCAPSITARVRFAPTVHQTTDARELTETVRREVIELAPGCE